MNLVLCDFVHNPGGEQNGVQRMSLAKTVLAETVLNA